MLTAFFTFKLVVIALTLSHLFLLIDNFMLKMHLNHPVISLQNILKVSQYRGFSLENSFYLNVNSYTEHWKLLCVYIFNRAMKITRFFVYTISTPKSFSL